MTKIRVERIGGLAGFAGARSHLRSRGEVDMDELSDEEKRVVESLFGSGGKVETSQLRDGFRYRISRSTADGDETIEAPEAEVPGALSECVKDELV